MKLSVALFFAGLFGALAAVFILFSFGTDYWLLASEGCHSSPEKSYEEDHGKNITLYHEGFFWRCSFRGSVDENHLITKLWFTNQPHLKECQPAYLFPFPVSYQTHNATEYDHAIIYRGFWSIFMLIGVAAVILGGFFIICAAPFASHRLYKAGGGFFLVSGLFLLCVVVMYVLWLQVLDVLDVYISRQRSSLCPGFQLSVSYGLSFMFAPVGIFFCLVAGLLFLLIGRTVRVHHH
ncbi:transmembrane protein 182 [Oryzias latipes]|uniref:transmembrane protein 182 n=1 Tax=Oryzias latipes TaxID=8090 RepID=UPI0002A4C947|nr:transmembrane protein 182 [Oryzias latipes]